MTMRGWLRTGLAWAAAAATLAVAACGPQAETPGGADLKVLHRGNSSEPLTLDPHKASGTWENAIIGDMLIGLTTEDAAGKPIPGMAERWETSADGLVWTFYLRDATWSDGVPVTAGDFVFAFRRLFDPATLAQYASVQYVINNAEAVFKREMPPEALGVRAIDDKTLEITLGYPAPYLPGLLTHYTAFPVPAHVVSRVGDAWVQPGNIVVNGPFKLEQWRTNDFVKIIRNTAFFDAGNVCLDEVFYYPTNDQNTGARMVRAGELDINNDFPGHQIETFRAQVPDYVRVSPFLTTDYLSFNTTIAPFDDARVRRALAMAVDTDFIVREILRAGQVAAEEFVPPGIGGSAGTARVPWTGQPLEARRAEAQRLLAEAGFGPDRPLRFEYRHRNSRDNPRIAPVLQADWQSIAPWVQVDIAAVETQIHYDQLRARNFQVGDGAWVADYNDASNFLYLFETRAGPMNYSGWTSPEFDALIAESNQTLDPDARADIMARAEQVMLDATPVAPMWHNVTKALVNPRVTGWVDNPVDIHRSRYLCFAE